MSKKKTETGISMFSRSENLLEADPLEEIFALNLGDFLSEHLISKELAEKIERKNEDKTLSLKNQLKELISIYSLNNTLKILGFSDKEDFVIFNAIAKTVKQMLEADACHIFLSKENALYSPKGSKDLVLVGSSFTQNFKNIGFNLDEKSFVTQVFNKRETLVIKDCKRSKKFEPIKKLGEEKTKYLLAIPMQNNFKTVGVLIIENYTGRKISDEFIDLIKITTRLFTTSLSLEKLTQETKELIENPNTHLAQLQNNRAELTALIGDLGSEQQMFVENLAKAVDEKSKFSVLHSNEVAQTAKEISDFIGLNEKTKDLIYYAALLRNIGKITLPEEIFKKKGKLTQEEWNKLQNHPNVGVSILMSINFMAEVIPYINYHKERWDGQGEPEGLKGNSIPLGARIVALADAYCALTVERPFRTAISEKEALKILQKEANIKWDPELVKALIQLKKG